MYKYTPINPIQSITTPLIPSFFFFFVIWISYPTSASASASLNWISSSHLIKPNKISIVIFIYLAIYLSIPHLSFVRAFSCCFFPSLFSRPLFISFLAFFICFLLSFFLLSSSFFFLLFLHRFCFFFGDMLSFVSLCAEYTHSLDGGMFLSGSLTWF